MNKYMQNNETHYTTKTIIKKLTLKIYIFIDYCITISVCPK